MKTYILRDSVIRNIITSPLGSDPERDEEIKKVWSEAEKEPEGFDKEIKINKILKDLSSKTICFL